MDADHRHELQQNDLAEFLAHFNQWWEKYGAKTVIVVLLAITGFVGVRLYYDRQAAEHERAWSELALSTSPDAFRAVGQAEANPIKALAYLRGADLLLERAMRPAEEPQAAGADGQPASAEGDAVTTEASRGLSAKSAQKPDRKQDLQTARQMYEEVAKGDKVALLLRLNARMGLASIDEAGGNREAAHQHYQAVIEQGADRYVALVQQAKARQEWLTRLAQPVVFAPTPKAVAAPTPAAAPTAEAATEARKVVEQAVQDTMQLGASATPEPASTPAPETSAPAPAPAQP